MLPSILHARIFNMINAATLYSYSHKTAKNDTKKKIAFICSLHLWIQKYATIRSNSHYDHNGSIVYMR